MRVTAAAPRGRAARKPRASARSRSATRPACSAASWMRPRRSSRPTASVARGSSASAGAPAPWTACCTTTSAARTGCSAPCSRTATRSSGRAEQQLELSGVDAVEGMRQLIAFTWDYYLTHPEFIRLLNSENLYRGEHVKKSRRVKALSFPLLSVLTDLLERGAQQRPLPPRHRPGGDLHHHRRAGLLLPLQPLHPDALSRCRSHGTGTAGALARAHHQRGAGPHRLARQ